MARGKGGSISAADFGWGAILFFLAASLFIFRINEPAVLVFDETHYVRQGQAFFALEEWSNRSHPPFAKWLIGLSSDVLGDTPFGWRLPGALLAASVVACVYAVMRLFGFSQVESGSAAVLTLANQTLFIQARTAMTDVYSLGFFALSATALIWSAKRARSKGGATLGLVLSGILLGLGASSKWSAGINMVLVWGGILVWRFTETSPKGMVLPRFFSGGFAGWNRLSLIGAGLRQGVTALATYALTFLPFLYMDGDFSFVGLHKQMLADVSGPLASHPYSSAWWEWPLMIEPIWYHFDRPTGQEVGDAAIFYVGNPVIYWGGLLATLGAFGFGVKRGDGALLAIGGAFLGFWLVWAVMPRDLTFMYYYEPAAMMLGMGLVALAARVAPVQWRMPALAVCSIAAVGMFAWFYPVLAAWPLEPDVWKQWVWFSSWP